MSPDILKDTPPPGSTLAIGHVTPDLAPPAVPAPECPRTRRSTREETARFFDGWVLESGITATHRRRPAPGAGRYGAPARSFLLRQTRPECPEPPGSAGGAGSRGRVGRLLPPTRRFGVNRFVSFC